MPRLYKELTKLNRKKTNTLHTTEKKKQNKTKQNKAKHMHFYVLGFAPVIVLNITT